MPVFGQNDYNKAKDTGCSSDGCDISYIIHNPPSGGGGGGCGEGPQGPQGPPGPAGPPGSSVQPPTKIHCGVLKPAVTVIDPVAFEAMMGLSGYMVALQGTSYDLSDPAVIPDATIVTDTITDSFGDPRNFIDETNGGPISINGSSNTEIFPIYRRETPNGSTTQHYQHETKFEDFVKLKGRQIGQGENHFAVTNPTLIPSLLKGTQGPAAQSYTFVCSDSLFTKTAGAGFDTTKFNSFVQGVTSGTIVTDPESGEMTTADEIQNPKPFTNLGAGICGEPSTRRDTCANCIQCPEEDRLGVCSDLGPGDMFYDTENGVLYTQTAGGGSFNENGMPMRRQPESKNVAFPNKKEKKESCFMVKIMGSTLMSGTSFRWTYACLQTFFNPNTKNWDVAGTSITALNGAETGSNSGVGNIHASITNGTFTLKPISNGVVVRICSDKSGNYVFSLSNGYSGTCP